MNAQSKIEAASLASAMAAAFGEIEAATKGNENAAFKNGGKVSKYADLTAVIEAIKPALINHGLFFTQHPEPHDRGVCIETVLHHAGGEHLSLGKLFVPANKQDAHGFGSALTYARRYALVTAFGVPVEDDDGNAAAKAQREPEPAKKEPAHSALKTKLRGFVHALEGCGDASELDGLLYDPTSQELIAELKAKIPAWWEGGEGEPPEFIPLKNRIDNKQYEFARRVADHATV